MTRKLSFSLEACMQVKKQHLESEMQQLTGRKLGKEYNQPVYCHPAYLTYKQNTSCEMLGWMDHKLESIWLEKYQQPQICKWYHFNGRKWRGAKWASWWRWKRSVKKLFWNSVFKKTKIMISSPIISRKIERKKVE